MIWSLTNMSYTKSEHEFKWFYSTKSCQFEYISSLVAVRVDLLTLLFVLLYLTQLLGSTSLGSPTSLRINQDIISLHSWQILAWFWLSNCLWYLFLYPSPFLSELHKGRCSLTAITVGNVEPVWEESTFHSGRRLTRFPSAGPLGNHITRPDFAPIFCS